MIFKNLTLIGTSHIAIESVKEVKKAIQEQRPKVVALELDRGRFFALMGKKQKLKLSNIKDLGIKGFIFTLVGAWIEEKLGKIVGVKPGTEMKVAAKVAKEVGARIALVDQEISITIKHLLKYITWKEKWHFVVDLFKGLVLRKTDIEPFDLTKVPEEKVIKKMVKQLKKRYPSFYKALIFERNVFMAKNLYRLMTDFKEEDVLAVVGAGHEKDIISLIKKEEKKSYSTTQAKKKGTS